MPAVQQGSVVRKGRYWQARWYDENGDRKSRAGFATKSDAWAWLRDEVDRIDSMRSGDWRAERSGENPYLSALVDEFLSVHIAEPGAIRSLTYRLKHATAKFGNVRVNNLPQVELRKWHKDLGTVGHDAMKSLKQVLNYGVDAGVVKSPHAAAGIKNPEPKRDPRNPFDSWDEVLAVADELPAAERLMPILGTLAGLRPGELLGFPRAGFDLRNRLLHVTQVADRGTVRPYPKTDGSFRAIPMCDELADAIERHTFRIDSLLAFPSPFHADQPMNLTWWNREHWTPAVTAAGIDRRLVPYGMRHTYATWAIAARPTVPTFILAKWMGTSVRMIEKHYGHLVPNAADLGREAFNNIVASMKADASESFGH